jgi:hypothetical protein
MSSSSFYPDGTAYQEYTDAAGNAALAEAARDAAIAAETATEGYAGTASDAAAAASTAAAAAQAALDAFVAGGGGGGSGAPTDADYLVKTANAGLSAERAVTDTPTVSWDWSTSGQAKAQIVADSILNTHLRNSTALSVIGNATNASADPADIVAGTDGHVLRRSGAAIGFGTVPAATITGLATVATSGSAGDLGTGTLPAARLPNPAATTLGGIQSFAAVANQWIRSISTSGVPAASQPNFTDLAGTIAVAQHAANVITNAKLAQVSTATFKGRATAGTGDPEDLTATQATALLNAMVGDSGAGGTKGLVPAPAAGDAAAGKYLKADGSYAVPPGSAGAADGLISKTFPGVSATLTIPTGATRALVKMWGAGGGGAGADAAASANMSFAPAGGGPAYVEKYLTGLTPGNTLVWTRGASGAGATGAGNTTVAGSDGGNSTLASGTQTISTITAGGGKGGGGVDLQVGGLGGTTGTNGDFVMSGQQGGGGFELLDTIAAPGASTTPVMGGVGGAGMGHGGEGSFSQGAAATGGNGTNGGIMIEWFA